MMEHITDTISRLASVTTPTTCTVVITWVASGLRLPRREVGRWPLSNWAVQFSRSSFADHRVCGPIAFGVPLPLSSDLCFDCDWPSGGCFGIFRGSVVRPCGCFSPFGEKSVPCHGTDVKSLPTWHHRQLPLEDDTWTMHGVDWHLLTPWQMVELWCQNLTAGIPPLLHGVSLDCFAEDTMYGLMSLTFCNALICWWL